MRVGVFDSGVGGLTVLKELIKYMPENEYVYVGDTLNMPYGNKSKEELLEYSCRIVDYLIAQKVDLIVIACGTLCSTVYEELISKYDIKIINIINETAKYINDNNIDNVLVLATHNTISSNVFPKLLNCSNLYLQACPKLASLIEKQDDEMYNYIDEMINDFKKQRIDLLVFGCTHYAIFDSYIPSKYGYKVINMGYAIIDELKSNMTNKESSGENKIDISFTKLDEMVIENTKKIIERDILVKEISL